MSRNAEWLSKFAESYGEKLNKTASKKKTQVVFSRTKLASAKNGDKIKYQGKMYRIADIAFEDEKGPGVLADEVTMGFEGTEMNPNGMEMGTANVDMLGGDACTVAPERAYTDPGNIFDLDVQSAEQAKFEAESAETSSKIMQEENIDRTQRSTPINLPSSNEVASPVGGEVMMDNSMPGEDYEVADDLGLETEEVSEGVCPECGSEHCTCEEDMNAEVDFREDEPAEVADDIDIEVEETEEESVEDEENDDEIEDEDESELEKMSSIANNVILKRLALRK